ncbi:hypothetical protein CANTEDRAFT_92218 [Yamadazyma tenuis ATCC 10573]|uniref:Uncharacterized protein n=1 Tax=Candida tenuis (strain ATCC 10573 / BCRC 21748 / CBS 615 / JCM 9827 / NBRC 10315 / NRRL Y-1498 / VKM Y-70) TaxID=590646 RepID=G3AYK8_CANTC|nr:uncharacterized protein CANTEDRAFT_92218 [Yamadazyma tenuis ATCC 10573]EGV65877.1 hypothetical protein CANTEDRAFT_92218 [Yamadazyma tenuis ATCC 10573]
MAGFSKSIYPFNGKNAPQKFITCPHLASEFKLYNIFTILDDLATVPGKTIRSANKHSLGYIGATADFQSYHYYDTFDGTSALAKYDGTFANEVDYFNFAAIFGKNGRCFGDPQSLVKSGDMISFTSDVDLLPSLAKIKNSTPSTITFMTSTLFLKTTKAKNNQKSKTPTKIQKSPAAEFDDIGYELYTIFEKESECSLPKFEAVSKKPVEARLPSLENFVLGKQELVSFPKGNTLPKVDFMLRKPEKAYLPLINLSMSKGALISLPNTVFLSESEMDLDKFEKVFLSDLENLPSSKQTPYPLPNLSSLPKFELVLKKAEKSYSPKLDMVSFKTLILNQLGKLGSLPNMYSLPKLVMDLGKLRKACLSRIGNIFSSKWALSSLPELVVVPKFDTLRRPDSVHYLDRGGSKRELDSFPKIVLDRLDKSEMVPLSRNYASMDTSGV